MLAENLKQVEENIEKACIKAGRKREEVTLVAVSKTKPVSMLSEIYHCGIRNFGENKVQELCEKKEELPSDIRWHMIGHLQRNKVKHVIRDAFLIHSVDSYRLAEEINIQAKKIRRIFDNIFYFVSLKMSNHMPTYIRRQQISLFTNFLYLVLSKIPDSAVVNF